LGAPGAKIQMQVAQGYWETGKEGYGNRGGMKITVDSTIARMMLGEWGQKCWVA